MKKLVLPVSVKQTTAPGAESEPPNKKKKISSAHVIEVDKLVHLDTSQSRWLSLKGIDLLRSTKLESHLEESSVITISISRRKY